MKILKQKVWCMIEKFCLWLLLKMEPWARKKMREQALLARKTRTLEAEKIKLRYARQFRDFSHLCREARLTGRARLL